MSSRNCKKNYKFEIIKNGKEIKYHHTNPLCLYNVTIYAKNKREAYKIRKNIETSLYKRFS